MRKLFLLIVSIVLLSQFAFAAGYPLNGTWELMDPDSWSVQYRQKNAPEGFVCGYVVDDAWGNNYFSMYVVKKRSEKKSETASDTDDVEVIEVVMYDGDVIYALKPGKMAYSWPDVFYRLPDKSWNDQYNILSDVKISDNPDIKVEYIDVDKERVNAIR